MSIELQKELADVKRELATAIREKQLVIETCERHAKLYEAKLEALHAKIKTLCGAGNPNSKE